MSILTTALCVANVPWEEWKINSDQNYSITESSSAWRHNPLITQSEWVSGWQSLLRSATLLKLCTAPSQCHHYFKWLVVTQWLSFRMENSKQSRVRAQSVDERENSESCKSKKTSCTIRWQKVRSAWAHGEMVLVRFSSRNRNHYKCGSVTVETV